MFHVPGFIEGPEKHTCPQLHVELARQAALPVKWFFWENILFLEFVFSKCNFTCVFICFFICQSTFFYLTIFQR